MFNSNSSPETDPAADKRVRQVCLASSCILLYNILTDYRSIIDAVKTIQFSPAISLLELLPFVILPVGIYYFWQKQKPGWTIIAAWLTFSIVLIIYTFALVQAYSTASRFSSMILSQPFIIHDLLPFLFYSSLLIYINIPVIRNNFNMNSNTRFLIIGLTAVATLLILFQI